ncbi:hypothetical protein NEUTE2DRAFT_170630 [Neurospora tetrasperma FGSC 2509]|nr:hypothetical protein NEUTE2DRAFT_170630 [Neurospora tetrasperma FGSC 2509]
MMRRSSHLRSLSLRHPCRCANLGPGEGITPGAITLPEELRSPDLYPPAKTDAGLSRPECTGENTG